MPDMRFAPPPAMRVVDRGGGLNQSSVRTYNERLVMSLLRQHGSLSRMELGQHSGLSAQTVSVIVRALERDGLILAGKAKRGRVGPPSTPMSLNPDGALAIGIKIGAKSTDTVLIDFAGGVRRHLHLNYDHPAPAAVLHHLATSIEAMTRELPSTLAERVVGIGIALPDGIESWPLPGWKAEGEPAWSQIDFEAAIREFSDLPIYIQNDVTAAAGAEIIFGAARRLGDFAYFFVGLHSASRLVLNHHIYAGRRRDAASRHSGIVSLSDLEKALAAAGRDGTAIWHSPSEWPDFTGLLDHWIEDCASSLAEAIISVCGFVDIANVIMDGRIPQPVLERLCVRTAEHLATVNAACGTAPTVLCGEAGPFAKAVGAAGLPFHSRFMIEQVGLASEG